MLAPNFWLSLVDRFVGEVLRPPVVEGQGLRDQQFGPLAAPDGVQGGIVGVPAVAAEGIRVVGEGDHHAVVVAIGDHVDRPLGDRPRHAIGNHGGSRGRIRPLIVRGEGGRVGQRQGEDVQVPGKQLAGRERIVHGHVRLDEVGNDPPVGRVVERRRDGRLSGSGNLRHGLFRHPGLIGDDLRCAQARLPLVGRIHRERARPEGPVDVHFQPFQDLPGEELRPQGIEVVGIAAAEPDLGGEEIDGVPGPPSRQGVPQRQRQDRGGDRHVPALGRELRPPRLQDRAVAGVGQAEQSLRERGRVAIVTPQEALELRRAKGIVGRGQIDRVRRIVREVDVVRAVGHRSAERDVQGPSCPVEAHGADRLVVAGRTVGVENGVRVAGNGEVRPIGAAIHVAVIGEGPILREDRTHAANPRHAVRSVAPHEGPISREQVLIAAGGESGRPAGNPEQRQEIDLRRSRARSPRNIDRRRGERGSHRAGKEGLVGRGGAQRRGAASTRVPSRDSTARAASRTGIDARSANCSSPLRFAPGNRAR